MILTISTVDRNSIDIGLYKNGQLSCFEFVTEKQSEDLLIAIEGILKQEKKLLKDIKAIAVNRGPGSYTGVRVGITVANTLGWSLKIPVFGFLDKKFRVFKKEDYKKMVKGRDFLSFPLPYYNKKLF